MKRALIYLRMSTDKQDYSIDKQRYYCEQYCNQQGFSYRDTDIIADEAISGGKNTRDGFVDVLNRLSEGSYDVLVLYSLERISRNLITLSLINENLTQWDIELHSVQGRINTSHRDSWMSFVMKAIFAEIERRTTIQRVRDGMTRKKEKMERCGLHTPYGYRLAADGEHNKNCKDEFCPGCKNIEPDDYEQEVREKANTMYHQFSKTPAHIARMLTSMFKNRNGNGFTIKSVTRMLDDYTPSRSKRKDDIFCEARSFLATDGKIGFSKEFLIDQLKQLDDQDRLDVLKVFE